MRGSDFANSAFRLAACWMLLFPLGTWAVEPSTQPVTQIQVGEDNADAAEISPGEIASGAGTNPTDPPADQSHPRLGTPLGQGNGLWLGRARQRILANSLTPTDLAEARKFMAEHSPNRLAAVDSLPDNERKKQIEELAALNYLNWMRLLKSDQELYLVVKNRVETEDKIFGLVTKLGKNPSNQSELSDLHEQVAKLVDLGIQERQLRLARLEATLNEQKHKLAEDSTNRSSLVESRFRSILNEGNKLPLNSAGVSRGHPGQRP